MSGPLAKPRDRVRRRNPPKIPTRSLPAAGFAGPYPRFPRGARPLGTAGKAWWHWAWRTPEAAAWDPGTERAVARRASLEDDDAALLAIEGLDVSVALDLLGDDEAAKAVRELEWVARRLASLVGGRLAIATKMLDLDRQLGLTTRSFHDLHFEIVGEREEPVAAQREAGDQPSGPRRLRAVDHNALAGA